MCTRCSVLPLVFGLMLLGPAPAQAQAGPAGAQAQPPAPAVRGFVAGLGGFTFGTQPSGGVAGQIGMPLTKSITVVGEVGYLLDVLPTSLADDLDDLAGQAGDLVGEPVTLEATVPALYALGSVRWSAPSRGKVRPFIEAGGGVARLSVEFTARVGDLDVSDELQREAGLEPSTKPAVAFGGGVEITLGEHLAASAGYRLLHVFAGEDVADLEDDEVSVNTSTIFGAIVYRF